MKSGGDEGYLEVSTDSSEWTRLATYDDTTAHWSTELVDLSEYKGEPAVQLRFSANSGDRLRWFIDDVYLSAGSKGYIYLPLLFK